MCVRVLYLRIRRRTQCVRTSIVCINAETTPRVQIYLLLPLLPLGTIIYIIMLAQGYPRSAGHYNIRGGVRHWYDTVMCMLRL